MTSKKIIIRDSFRLIGAITFCGLYIPHLCVYLLKHNSIDQDLTVLKAHNISFNLPNWLACLFLIHNDSYFRSYFYFRIGTALKFLIGWWRPGNKYFNISSSTKVGKGFRFFHPYGTVLNAESIGDSFGCLQLTTLGDKHGARPVIGNFVRLGANVTIIGNVHIGDYVEIGAGSVVVKDIPSCSIAVGNPARVVATIDPANYKF